MKAYLTCIIILNSFLLSEVSAQFFMGASAGLNVASAKITPSENPNPQSFVKPSALGFTHLGLLAGYKLSDKWSILMDAQISHKGYHSFDPALTDVRHRFTYLDFLPQVEYSLFKNLTLSTGFNVGFMTREMFRLGNGQWQRLDFVESVRLTDIGLVGSIKLHHQNVFIVGRYNHGVRNLFIQHIIGNIVDGAKLRNITFQIGAGYIFHRGKGRTEHKYY